jgi:hypothetical protein
MIDADVVFLRNLFLMGSWLQVPGLIPPYLGFFQLPSKGDDRVA